MVASKEVEVVSGGKMELRKEVKADFVAQNGSSMPKVLVEPTARKMNGKESVSVEIYEMDQMRLRKVLINGGNLDRLDKNLRLSFDHLVEEYLPKASTSSS